MKELGEALAIGLLAVETFYLWLRLNLLERRIDREKRA